MKNNKLTVVIVNDFDYIQGGASKVALDTAQGLYDNNVNIIFFSATHKDNNHKFKQISTYQKECLNDGIKGALRGLYNFKTAQEFKKLLRTLDKEKTVIHVHGWTKSLSSCIFRIAGQNGFKVILTLHDYFTVCPNGGFFNYKKCKICKKKAMSFKCINTNCDSRNYLFKLYRVLRQFIQNKNFRKCKNLSLINISDFSLDKLKSYYKNKINVYKVYNPIMVSKQPRAKIEKNDYYIFVGRVSKEKGVDIFCEAMNKLKLNAIVVGDGDQLSVLKNKYSKSNIEFVGWKDSNEVNVYMKKAKALIFPSKLYEGAPLTILEALAIGLPCVVSNKCAAIDFVTRENGLSFDGTVEDLITQIKKYEKKDLKQLSEKAYDIYWSNPYDITRYYNSLLEIYKLVLEENHNDFK